MRVKAEKPCPFCRRVFRPWGPKAKYCSRACANRGTPRKQKATAKVRGRLELAFGPLSVRDLALIDVVDGLGFQRGYHKARRDNRREETAA